MSTVFGEPQKEKVAFTFAGLAYVQRFHKGNLTEYTPKGKPDLDKFADMLTINTYSNVTTGEGLAKAANGVVDAYSGAGGQLVKTSSVPRTAKKEAEHLIVVLFPTDKFVEVAFARIFMSGGKGYSVVYSKRTYGANAKSATATWLKTQQAKTEKAIMAFTLPKA